jgi:hypothetical protein
MVTRSRIRAAPLAVRGLASLKAEGFFFFILCVSDSLL